MISDLAVENWFVKFSSGDMTLKDEPRAARPLDFDEDVLKSIMEQNSRQLLRKLAAKVHTSQ
jgi:hypothetical protein